MFLILFARLDAILLIDDSETDSKNSISSVVIVSFVLLQVAACLYLARRWSSQLLQYPENVHHYRKLRNVYQFLLVILSVTQVIFHVMSGLMTAYSLSFRPGINLLLIVFPILLSIIMVSIAFVAIESKYSRNQVGHLDVIDDIMFNSIIKGAVNKR